MYAGCSSDKDFVQKCEDCQAKLAPHVQDFIMYVPCIVMQLPSKVYCHSQCALAGQEGHQSKCKRCVCIVKGRDKVTAWLRQDPICDLNSTPERYEALQPAYGNQVCAPLSIDQHMQGPGFGSWHEMFSSNCAADDKFRKGERGLCSKRCFFQVLLKYFCHVTKAKLHETEVSGVASTLSELAFVVNEVSAGLLLLSIGSDARKPDVTFAVDTAYG